MATVVVIALIAWAVWWRVRGYWPDIAAYEVVLNPGWLGGGMLLLLAGFASFAFTWSLILDRLGYPASRARLVRLWFTAQPAKYLPGSLWYAVGRAYGVRDMGIPFAAAISSSVLEAVLLIPAAAITAGLLSLTAGPVPRPFLLGAAAAASLLCLMLLNPRILRFVLRRVKGVENAPMLHLKDTALLLALYVIGWLLAGAGIAALARGVMPIPAADLPYVASVFIASWVIGFVAVLAPAGIGIREGAFVVLLAPIMAVEAGIVIAAFSRLWWIVAEVALAAVAGVANRRVARSSPDPVRAGSAREEGEGA